MAAVNERDQGNAALGEKDRGRATDSLKNLVRVLARAAARQYFSEKTAGAQHCMAPSWTQEEDRSSPGCAQQHVRASK